MSDRDDLIRRSLDDLRQEPDPGLVDEVFSRRARRDRRRRAIATVAVAMVAMAALVSAIPPARGAVTGAFDAIGGFFGGDDPPTGPDASDLSPAMLEWLGDTGTGPRVVLAEASGERLVAYREPRSGLACLAYSTRVKECDDPRMWRRRFSEGGADLLAPLFTTPSTSNPARLIAWGVAGTGVSRVRIVYPGRPPVEAPLGAGGFALDVPEGITPARIEGLDADDRIVARAAADVLQWDYP